MGWTFISRHHGATTEEILRRECLSFAHLPADQRPEIIASASGAGVMAFAVRMPPAFLDAYPHLRTVYVPATDSTVTMAEVILHKRNRDGFGFKEMAETAGPFYWVSPSILKHLSPLQPMGGDGARHAEAWRDSCREAGEAKAATRHKANSIKPGMRVRFASPLTFRSGASYSEFIATEYPTIRRGRTVTAMGFRAPDGNLCRLPAKALASAEILEG